MAKMLAATQILSMVIRPALSKINLWSPNAEELVLGTAIVESGLTYIRQWGDGPALGLWQVEPSTQNDLYTNFLHYRPELGSKLIELRAAGLSLDENLATNLMYGAAVCRRVLLSETGRPSSGWRHRRPSRILEAALQHAFRQRHG